MDGLKAKKERAGRAVAWIALPLALLLFSPPALCQPTETPTPTATPTVTPTPTFTPSAGSVSGNVTGPGDVEGMPITAYTTAWADAGRDYVNGGSYRIDNLLSGDYYLFAFASDRDPYFIDEYYDNHYRKSDADIVTVTAPGETSGKDFAIEQGGVVRGNVQLDGVGGGIMNATVELYVNTGDAEPLRTGASDGGGPYEIRGVPAGSYYAKVNNSWNEWYDGGQGTPDPAGALQFEVIANGDTNNIDFWVSDAASISGHVQEETGGAPISNMRVDIYASPFRGGLGAATTDANGNYTIGNLAGGTYYLQTNSIDKNSNYIPEWYDGSGGTTDPNQAQPVSATVPGDSGGVDFYLAGAGSIGGSVRADGGGIIIGMEVRLYDQTFNQINFMETDASGGYRFLNLDSGTYYLDTFSAGSGKNLQFTDEYYDNKSNQQSADPVVVTAPNDRNGIDFSLAPLAGSGTVSGRVLDASSSPIQGLSVTLQINNDWWESAYVGTQTDASGDYTIYGLGAGEKYYVRTRAGEGGRSYIDEWYDNQKDPAAAVQAIVSAAGIDFTLEPAGRITGYVKDDGGSPLSGMNVSANNYDNPGPAYQDTTKGDGTYEITGLPYSDYRVWVSEPGYRDQYYDHKDTLNGADRVTVNSPVTSGINFDLTAVGTISGSVTGPGDVEDMEIVAYDTGWNKVRTTNVGGGQYTLNDLTSGNYYVFAAAADKDWYYIDEYYNNQYAKANADPVTVNAPAETAGIDFAIEQGGVVRGNVNVDGGGGIANAVVELYVNTGDPGPFKTSYSRVDGHYEVHGVAPGSYYAKVSGWDEWYDGGQGTTDPAAALQFVITAGGDTNNIDFWVSDYASITGHVQHQVSGLPIPNMDVSLFTSPSGDAITSARADGNGDYTIGNLAGGNYYLQARPNDPAYNYIPEWYDGGTGTIDPNQAQVVATTVPEESGNVNFYLLPAGAISGTVASTTGPPIRNIVLDAFKDSPTGNPSSANAATAADGSYALLGLATGTYYVSTNSGGLLFQDEWYNDVPASDPGNAVPVSVTAPGETSGIDFGLLPQGGSGAISGRIEAAGGIPIAGMSVSVHWNNDWNDGPYTGTVTNGAGDYVVEGLNPGDKFYARTNAKEAGLDYIDEWYDDAVDPAQATSVMVSGSGIDFTLDKAGKIAGFVRDENGINPLPGVTVKAESYDGGGGAWENSSRVDGTYEIEGLPAGDYRVWTESPSYLSEYYYEKADWNGADRVAVSAGATADGIDFTLQKQEQPGTITGTVTVPEGDPQGIRVVAYDTGWSQVRDTNTDPGGTYELKDLQPGGYYVFCDASWKNDFFTEEYYNNRYWAKDADEVTVSEGQAAGNVNFAIEKGGRIGGHVYIQGGNTQEGVFNAVVEIVDTDKTTVLKTATTNESGWYEFRGLPAPRDYYARAPQWSTWYNQADEAGADLVHLEPGEKNDGIDFAVPAAGSITGLVYKNAGNLPIPNMQVMAWVSQWQRKQAVTGTDGRYAIRGLADGTYFANVAPTEIENNYVPEWYNDKPAPPPVADPIVVTIPSESGNVDFGLDPAAAVRGAVLTDGGSPVGGIKVSVDTDPNGENWSAETGGDGTYTVLGIPSGSYYAHVNGSYDFWQFQDEWYDNSPDPAGATAVSLAAPDIAGGVDFSLSPDTGAGALSGAVVEDGALGGPVADLTIAFYDWPDEWGLPRASTRTNVAGDYTLEGLKTGTQFYVKTSSEYPDTNYVDEWYDDTTDPQQAQQVTATQAGVDFALRAAGAITGTVTDYDSGAPLQGASLYAWGWYDDPWQPPAAFASTKGDGTYVMEGLDGDTYKVIAAGFGWYLNEWYNDCRASNCITPIDVTPPGVAGDVDFALEKGGRIAGYVRESDGSTPIPGAGVGADPAPYGDEWMTGADTGGDGSYITGAVPPGNYYVGCKPPDGRNFVAEFYEGAIYPEEATTVPVAAEAVTGNVNFTLDEGGSISGAVNAGGPAADVKVTAVLSDHEDYDVGAETGGDGSYEILGLPPDKEYYVLVEIPPPGYSSEYYADVYTLAEATLVHVSGTGDTAGIDFDLEQAAQISGTVSSANTGAPVAGATAFAINFRSQGYHRSTTTTSTGYYQIDGLPPTRYRVVAMAEGYANQFYDGKADWDSGDILILGAGESRSIDFSLSVAAAGTISGSVYYGGPADPDRMIAVAAFPSKIGMSGGDPYEGSAGMPQSPPPITFLTGYAPGENPYTLSGSWSSGGSAVPPGKYWVLAILMSQYGEPVSGVHYYRFSPVDITAGGALAGIDIFIPYPGSGDTDGDGMPDDWETFYGTNPLVPDAGEDPDSDRFTNFAEYIGGTKYGMLSDPQNASLGGQAINLEPGWNLMGISTDVCFYVTEPSAAEKARIPVSPGNYVAIQDWNGDGSVDIDDLLWTMGIAEYVAKISALHPDPAGGQDIPVSYERGMPPQMNDLEYMAGGFGYWMTVDRSCVWAVDDKPRLVGPGSGITVPLSPGWNLMSDLWGAVHWERNDPAVKFGSDETPPRVEESDVPDYIRQHVYIDGAPAQPEDVERMIAMDEDGIHTYYYGVPHQYQTLRYIGPGMGLWINIRDQGGGPANIEFQFPAE